MMRMLGVIAMGLFILPATAWSDTGFQFQFAGAGVPDNSTRVDGVRLYLLSAQNERVSGFDLGFAALSEVETQEGFSFNLGISRVTGSSSGAAGSLVNLHTGNDSGLNIAPLNIVKKSSGVNGGMLNITEGSSAVDIGMLNMSKKSQTQLGMLNFTNEIQNLQVGLLNFADNGIFPVFPFFNYPKP